MQINRKWAIGGGVAALVLAGGIYGGTALAQNSATPSPSATPSRPAAAAANFQNFVSHLAQRLNVSQDQVTAALKGAEKDTVGDAVKAGRLTQQQADRIDQRIDSGQFGPGFGFGAGPGFRGGPHGRPFAGGTALNAAANALGMQPSDLVQQLRSGKTLKDVAASKNVDFSKVTAAISGALKPQLDQAVSSGRLTSQQEQNILNRINSGQFPFGTGWRHGPRPSSSAAPTPSAG